MRGSLGVEELGVEELGVVRVETIESTRLLNFGEAKTWRIVIAICLSPR